MKSLGLRLSWGRMGALLAVGFVGYLVWHWPTATGIVGSTFISHTWHLAGAILSKLGDFIGGLTSRGASGGPTSTTRLP